MTQVFISYAREDVAIARRLRTDLKKAGIQTWLDEDDLLPGRDWKDEISKAIASCRYFIAILSENSTQKRGYVQKELKAALEIWEEFPSGDVFLIPVRVNECKTTYSKLKDLHWVDLFPSWKKGIEKILLTVEIQSGSKINTTNDRFLHPKDRSFYMSSNWTDEGLEIQGGNVKVPAKEAMALFKIWVDWVSDSFKGEVQEFGSEEAYERAYITGTIRAFYEVFGAVPSEEEMERGSSVMSRKMNLFYNFSRDIYIKSNDRKINLKEYLFPDTQDANKSHIGITSRDKRNFYRTLLRAYISRLCDVNLEEVEKIENAMRGVNAPPWETLVEGVYGIDETKVLQAYKAIKEGAPDEPDDQIVDNMTLFFIESAGLEEYPFDDPQDTG